MVCNTKMFTEEEIRRRRNERGKDAVLYLDG
jgi:hypothetical protein